MLLLIHLKIKEKITGQRHNNGTKKVKIMVPLKYLSNFWGTLEMCLINWEINLDLNWSKNCVIEDLIGNLNQEEGATMLFTIKETAERILHFSQGTIRVLWMSSSDLSCSTIYFCFNIISI